MSWKTIPTTAGLWLLLSYVGVYGQTSPSVAKGLPQTMPAAYDAKWAVVDSLVNKAGLPQSALTVINRIYTIARQEHNDGQAIKALVSRITVQEGREENADTAAVKELEAAIVDAGQPARSILQSLLAHVYWNYLQRNRWKLYNRTATNNEVKGDIGTWPIDEFHRKISALYLASLQAEELLKRISLQQYEPILIKGNSQYLRPTLFDLLAHEALDYFVSSETDINQPADVFAIDDTAVFADATVFAAHTFHTNDTMSTHYKALKLFQRLIKFHQADPRPDALIDVDIERITFAHTYAVMEDKEDFYLQALIRLTDRFGDLPVAAEAWYLQAQHDADMVNRQEVADSAYGRFNGRAKAICERVLAQRDSSQGQTNCQQLLKRITNKSLSFQIEKINLPGQPFRSLVTWHNIGQLHLRLVRIDSLYMRTPSRILTDEQYWKQLLAISPVRSFVQDLPETGDYWWHSTEIAIGGLPPGAYALLGSNDDRWDSQSILAAGEFYVSAIAYVNQGLDFFVVNRATGHPLSGATVKVWTQLYSPHASSWVMIGKQSYLTDGQGHFLVDGLKKDEYGDRLLEIITPGDRLMLRDEGVPYFPFEEKAAPETKEAFEKEHARVYLFLDRSIYRPGQLVYFKGIAVTTDFDTQKPKVWAGRGAKVSLYNANNEKVDSLELTSNEWGSYHGSFRLPEHQLNGNFRICDEDVPASQSFAVEEYKRPGFEVKFDPQKGSYRVGDSIRVRGNALAYAGNAVNGAMIKYRVFRQMESFRRLAVRAGLRGGAGQEITHGEGLTDSKGDFRLVFAALPDRHAFRSADLRYEYVVEADITDINGETRSGSTQITAGYTVLNLSIDLPEDTRLPADSLRAIAVGVTNLSGEPVASRVHVAAYPLQAPTRLIRERMWQAPDRWVLSESAYLDSFPHDEYREETKKETWARGTMAWEVMDSANGGGMASDGRMTASIPMGKLSPGWWLIEADAIDAYGQPVKEQRYVELYDSKTGRPGSPEYNWTANGQATVEPGGKASTVVGSSAEDVYVIRKLDRAGETFQPFTLNNNKNTTEWTVGEADRGGFGVSDIFIKDNRLYTHRYTVTVPWTNKELQIRYATYRDKTEPGSGEKWAITIAGYRGGQVAAEVLTAMYDASLDQFAPQSWSTPMLFPEQPEVDDWESSGEFKAIYSRERYLNSPEHRGYYVTYDRLLSTSPTYNMLFKNKRFNTALPMGQSPVENTLMGIVRGVEITGDTRVQIRGYAAKYDASDASPLYIVDGMEVTSAVFQQLSPGDIVSITVLKSAGAIARYGSRGVNGVILISTKAGGGQNQQQVVVRKNFNETAFFFPDLQTDSVGDIRFSFIVPEALTRWKWMTLAHTRDLAFGYSEKTIVTQKQLMVQPNLPRFLREGDKMDLSAKIVNLTDSEMTGQMSLQLTDPTTGETADGWFVNRQPNQYFTVGAHSSEVVNFPVDIPFQYNRPLTYRIVAQAGNYSDGEEATLPVVSNRMLVTETLPLTMPGDGTRSFHFDKLLQSGNSETLNHHALTVEFTANPAWYAVQALPYLIEYPYECAEQTFDRFYANALASKIVNSSPRLAQVFSAWRTTDTAALLSNLEKNPELKSVLLEETPWVLQGKTEEQQKKNIALLFDLSRMSRQLAATIDRLRELQTADGSFAWFKGGYDDRYITQYILTGFGKLQQLQALPPELTAKVKAMVMAALPFVDGEIRKDYDKEKAIGDRVIGELPVQYLYMRSMFNDYGIPGNVFPAVNYYRKKVQQNWISYNKYMQGMIALALFRTGDVQTARNIIASLRQNAIHDEEKGMWWKGMEGGYYWYQAPVETQSLLIEAFREISGDATVDRELKTWLLRQKQTHSWATTVATADACYALLLGGGDWLSAEREVEVKLGDKYIHWGDRTAAGATATSGNDTTGEAGTGYYKKIFDAPFINPSMGNITVTMHTAGGGVAAGHGAGTAGEKPSGSPAWGAVYWQYFDQLDQIKPAGGGAKAPLKLTKRLFIQRNTDRGPVLDTIADNGSLKVGDRLVVRIELRADRDLEYVHMKDMRAACLEPVNVLSQYKWQGGLGYYETTKDASTEFFFPEVRRGTYVFEYTLIAGQTGNFSNGIASVECMYAPEYADHSEGIRINVEGAP